MKTIEVNGWNSPIQMTKDEFTKTWRDHVGELLRINPSDTWTREVAAMAEKVINECHAEFDRLWEQQNC